MATRKNKTTKSAAATSTEKTEVTNTEVTEVTNTSQESNEDVLVAEMGDYKVMQIPGKKKGGYYVINELTGEDTRNVGDVKTTRKHRSGGSEGNGKAYSFAVAGWSAVGFNELLFKEGYAITCQVTRQIEKEHGTWQKAMKAAGISYTNHLASSNGNPETDAEAREKLDGILSSLARMKPKVKEQEPADQNEEAATE